jgi:myo-inositol-1(or 4)-monophosphatase
MDDRDLDARLEAARETLREAGRLALDYFAKREELVIEAKGLQDLVSIADRNVEELIRERLGAAFPGDEFLGEEHGGGIAPHLWIIDPIDGTANFLRGMPYWSCTLAFAVDSEAMLGLTYDPVHDELFWARKGHGTYRNGKRVEVSTRGPSEACVGLSYSFKTPPEDYEALIRGLLADNLDHRRMGSAALSLCHTADGRLDALVCLTTNSWDVLPGLLLVTEAGGIATRYTDGCTLLERRSAAAASPAVVEMVERASGIRLRPTG